MLDVLSVSLILVAWYTFNLYQQRPLKEVERGNVFLLDDVEFIVNVLDWNRAQWKKDPLNFWKTWVPCKMNPKRIVVMQGLKKKSDFTNEIEDKNEVQCRN